MEVVSMYGREQEVPPCGTVSTEKNTGPAKQLPRSAEAAKAPSAAAVATKIHIR